MAENTLPSADALRALFDYDRKTGHLTRRVANSNCVKVGEIAGTLNAAGYLVVRIGPKLHYVHRVIWCMETGDWPENEIDHENGHRADNRWRNLREATHAENCRNVRRQRTKTIGLKGTCYMKRVGNWQAHIHLDGRKVHLGVFDSTEDAHGAYMEAAKEHFGEFAREG